MVLLKVLGLSATILAMLQGAPFWKDLLGKILSLRAAGAGKKDEKETGNPANVSATGAVGNTPTAAHSSANAEPVTLAKPTVDAVQKLFEIPYSNAEALRMAPDVAYFAQIAYQQFSIIKEELDPLGLELKQLDKGKSTQGFLALCSEKQLAIIAFRGSKELEDWLANAKIDFADDVDSNNPSDSTACKIEGKVHKGFKDALNEVYKEDLRPAIEDARKTCSKLRIVLAGHSLGGALAVLCASRFARQGIPVHAVFTYGMPRVGDQDWAKSYDKALRHCTYRYVNRDDGVPLVPLAEEFWPDNWQSQKYQHVGQLQYIDYTGQIRSEDSYLWRLARLALLGSQGGVKSLACVAENHDMGAYREALARLNARNLSARQTLAIA